jgi:hypothetical protein
MAAPSEQIRAAVVPVRKPVSLRARQGRPASEADSPSRVLGLRRSPDARRWARVRLHHLFEPMAKSMVLLPVVGALSSCGFSRSGTAGSAIESSALSQMTYGLAGRCLVRRPAHGCKQTGEGKSIMRNNMTVEDAINVVHVLGCDLVSNGDEDVRQLVSAATWLVSYVQDQGAELERERSRRHGIGHRDAATAEGHRLENGVDGGGRRDFLAGRGVHAGKRLYLLTYSGWHPVRYESNMPRNEPCLYLPLPGVREDVVFWVPREARFVWPEELRLAPR